ncbi:hypothetical protein FXN65_14690 [Metapseudomonas lalkuanensis]|uniref:Uncharacterized protein n=1 Tax=Metapseudomonas lalkuanensis TaxID=2604832 RepID=A0A5J6QKF9_9GAMM|nr:hypothetical protein [Pseudomonas lalkuanensis]QEY63238.1 hypothetical protein FXN65_14690 [Pseudomonas lalkuanensis]
MTFKVERQDEAELEITRGTLHTGYPVAPFKALGLRCDGFARGVPGLLGTRVMCVSVEAEAIFIVMHDKHYNSTLTTTF